MARKSLSLDHFYEKLIELLDQLDLDGGDDGILATIDPDRMTDEHRVKFDAIYRRCCVEEDQDHQERQEVANPSSSSDQVDGGSRSAGTRKRQKTGTKKAEMMRLSTDVHIPETLLRVLNNPEIRADPQILLQDGVIPMCDVGSSIAASDIGGAFHSCYDLILCLKDRSTVDRLVWTFLMKWMYNLVRLLDPKYSGRRFGVNMKRDFIEFIQENFQDPASQAEASENADKWSRCGLKISQLCAEFGSGCVFYLARHFCEDFFENKYRETGKTKEAVFSELHAAGLKQLVARSGANELCDNVDAYLIDTFRQFFATRRGQ